MSKKVTVLVPAYNEGDRIKSTIDAMKASNYVDRIVIIDDGSKDNTYTIAKSTHVEVYRLDENRGKGFALNFGIEKVQKESDIIIFLDGDIGKTASEIDNLILPILEDQADVTIARFPAAKKKGGFGLVKNLAKYGALTWGLKDQRGEFGLD
jgi:glycosyltransferase involved in cell wall biosynthesis